MPTLTVRKKRWPKMDEDVYELLTRDLENNVGLDYSQALEVVEFLTDNDFIDYDTLKEIYLYDEES